MAKRLVLTLIFLAVGWAFYLRKPDFPMPEKAESPLSLPSVEPVERGETVTSVHKQEPYVPTRPRPVPQKFKPAVPDDSRPTNGEAPSQKFTLPYVIEDGLAVVQGDIVIGKPEDPETPETGSAVMPELELWPSPVIPFHIQADLPNHSRVKEALEFFRNTPIQFVTYTDQEDALVFENGTDHCKSYAGRVGGLQPIWLSPECGPREIAHEIMHALGFIHEQNRMDRDAFVQIIFENVDERYKVNFEKFPESYMKASGLAKFDYRSLMIYSPQMFSRGGLVTMQSKINGQEIAPGPALSSKDIERLQQLYGR